MISFSITDFLIIIFFFLSVITIGFYTGRKTKSDAEDYLLSGRNLGLIVFVMINVSTWYGGILGVGEFTYRYGIVSWFTQGFPYYIFALLFALLFAGKIRKASLFTIPDKISEVYSEKAGMASAVIVFILVSPAPYLLMTANLISLIFGINLLPSIVISLSLSIVYLVKGGFRSNVFVDVFQFFVMFSGFIIILIFSGKEFGTIEFISASVPESHLDLTGGMSPAFLIVWFLIALWTFADPGFHQRCYAAKSGDVAKWGIIISILFWALFDFLTTSTGLYAKAVLPELDNPVLSFPLYAEKVLPSGFKGIFYAALFATILSTQISFLFLSGTTIGRDFIYRYFINQKKIKSTEEADSHLKNYTITGLFISGLAALLFAYFIPSVIEIWYTIGSMFIPGIIIPVVSAYYHRLKISSNAVLIEMTASVFAAISWNFLRSGFSDIPSISEIEPMILGLTVAFILHIIFLLVKK
ncbi:MAG: sodium:solute symporter family protein [Ignavibacteriaceae bacterium]